MKLTKFLLKVAGLFVLFIMFFTLSSKGSDPFDIDLNDFCGNLDHAEDETALLYINFIPDGGWYNIPFRYTGYESYLPYQDLRSGYSLPASNLLPGMHSYYCFVEVTTPDCLDWVHTTRMNYVNGGGTGNITIQVPRRDNLWDLNIKVKYYERCSDGTYSSYNDTLRYAYEYTFQGGLPVSAGEVINLIPETSYNCNDFGNSSNGSNGIEVLLDEIENQQP